MQLAASSLIQVDCPDELSDFLNEYPDHVLIAHKIGKGYVTVNQYNFEKNKNAERFFRYPRWMIKKQ